MDPVAGKTSAVFDVTVDTVAPSAPVISSDVVSSNVVTLTGTAEASSTVTVFNGTTQLGTATVNGSGAWSFPAGSWPTAITASPPPTPMRRVTSAWPHPP